MSWRHQARLVQALLAAILSLSGAWLLIRWAGDGATSFNLVMSGYAALLVGVLNLTPHPDRISARLLVHISNALGVACLSCAAVVFHELSLFPIAALTALTGLARSILEIAPSDQNPRQ